MSSLPPWRSSSITAKFPSPSFPRILVNGRLMDIRPNLYLCLTAIKSIKMRHWRSPIRSPELLLNDMTYFWIDAICIDQSNIAKRNHQVNMMKRIYSQATTVLVWLGKADNKTDKVFDSMSSLNLSHDDETRQEWDSRRDEGWLDSQLTTVFSENILSRPYWGRLWIIQELMLAQDILLMCGDRALPWRYLTSWLKCSREDSDGESESTKQVMETRGYQLLERKVLWQQNTVPRSRYTLDFLIEAFYDQRCADVRDKVYGLLGLLTTDDISGGNVVEVDYAKTPLELYEDVLVAVKDSPRLQSQKALDRFSKTLRKALALS
ncbi:heterokaryon incompatibility protein-domain-containing protein [Lasiosphaeris hirsuta]|uniref:Heterokaryon incompatibility protein-domain-containing protein n=1 Tax=Lasiosphaeris hirsuta TaxID=260670 RepID=A0AA40AHW4_9PEZI|nr:heterokaryon incompatibility protein-domain-containing protein [Lasiosphaeris hirsuta]